MRTIGRESEKETLRKALRVLLPEAVDETRAREIAREEYLARGALRVEVVRPNGEVLDVGRQHPAFPMVLRFVALRRPVMLVGPAGTGKTTAAHKAFEACGLTYGGISVGPQTTQVALFGFVDAGGTYRETEFRRRFEHGGGFLIDEMDRGNPAVLTALNQALENDMCSFPDGTVRKHPDFVVVAAANTYGMGANRVYVGATQLDAATLDRFAVVDWPVNEAFEEELAYVRALATDAEVGLERVAAWTKQVQAWRRKADKLGIRHVISPRASIYGAQALVAGMDQVQVEAALVWRGLDVDSVKRIKGKEVKEDEEA